MNKIRDLIVMCHQKEGYLFRGEMDRVRAASAELTAMQERIDKLETENERLNKIIHAVDVALRRRLKSGETVYNIISAAQDALGLK